MRREISCLSTTATTASRGTCQHDPSAALNGLCSRLTTALVDVMYRHWLDASFRPDWSVLSVLRHVPKLVRYQNAAM